MKLICPHCGSDVELGFILRTTTAPDGAWRAVSINDMELSTRVHNCLLNLGITTAGEIDATSNGRLLALPNFGRRSLREVREAIADLKGNAHA